MIKISPKHIVSIELFPEQISKRFKYYNKSWFRKEGWYEFSRELVDISKYKENYKFINEKCFYKAHIKYRMNNSSVYCEYFNSYEEALLRYNEIFPNFIHLNE